MLPLLRKNIYFFKHLLNLIKFQINGVPNDNIHNDNEEFDIFSRNIKYQLSNASSYIIEKSVNSSLSKLQIQIT